MNSTNNKEIEWIFNLQKEVPVFLNELKSELTPGFYKYSLSGDILSDKKKWGLGNTVFAVKLLYTLGVLNNYSTTDKKILSNFILNFKDKNGMFYDNNLLRKSFLRKKLSAIKNRDLANFFNKKTKIAETKQAISTLKLLNVHISSPEKIVPNNFQEISKYLNNLDWSKPWGAGSHFAHLCFFLNNSDLKNKRQLIDYAINWVNNIQKNDGFWYTGKPSTQQKINGAMKIIRGLTFAGYKSFQSPKKIIDGCLKAKNDSQACDNFNVIYNIYKANEVVEGNYRQDEIRRFASDRIKIYKNYYHQKKGGFSFHLNKSGFYYYGTIITKAKNEPDIHGTFMFLWGLSMIAKILKIEKKTNLVFQES
ncbi:hypothetical protein C0584_01780 [Candidatus Parcubacteria bacterium]|nr:MAG: hypothetical protein C0584_01780 [Candidatus Parcubacteria bacterium]